MSYAERERKCSTCDNTVKGRIPLQKAVFCIDCALKKAAESARQMANKSGPYYDQWLTTQGPKGRPAATR